MKLPIDCERKPIAMKTLSQLFAVAASALFATAVYADIPKESDVPPLIKKLTNGNAKARAEAAKDLGEIGMVKAAYTKPAIPALLKAAKDDKDNNVRRAALIALGQVDPQPDQAMPVFIAGLKSNNDQVKIAAAEGVGHLGGNAKEALVELRKIREENSKLDKKVQDKKRPLMRAVNEAIQQIQQNSRKK